MKNVAPDVLMDYEVKGTYYTSKEHSASAEKCRVLYCTRMLIVIDSWLVKAVSLSSDQDNASGRFYTARHYAYA